MDAENEITNVFTAKYRRGFPLWVLKEMAGGKKLNRFLAKWRGSTRKLEFFGVVGDESFYWRENKKFIKELVATGKAVSAEKIKRDDGTSVETFDLTNEAREYIESKTRRANAHPPIQFFHTEQEVLDAVNAAHDKYEAEVREYKVREGAYFAQKEASSARERIRAAFFSKTQLSIELVPRPLWGENLRKFFSKSDWDTIRTYIYMLSNNRCRCCGVRSFRLHCHEVWEYDDEKHVQKFMGCRALCEDCHNIKHIGYAGIRADKGELDYNALITHYCRVNECDDTTFYLHRGSAMALWSRRSSHTDWTLDWRLGKELLDVAKMETADGDLPPSQSRSVWLRTYRECDGYPDHTERGGKWLVFLVSDRHDALWEIVKNATQEGKLGGSSKASTGLRPDSDSKAQGVICIYTYDGDDETDVMRVREVLRDLGVTWKIYWKADEATLAGLYTRHGDRNVSRYGA